MIECKELSYTVGKKQILSNVSITVPDGRITVIIGNNGSGKTTLIRAVTAYHERRKAITGSVLADGEPLDALTPREASRRMALLPQTLPTTRMTVRELVSLSTASLRSPFSHVGEKERATIENAIASVGLSALADAPIERLSGGERQSAYFAMILARGAQNILLDEPTSALDSRARTRLFRFLRKMRDEGRAILTVLHDLTDASEIADRIIALDGGRVVFDGTPEALAASDIPCKLFGVISQRAEASGKKMTIYLPER